MLNLEQKKAVVAEVHDVAGKAHSAIGAEYAGLNVAAMTELRKQAREAGVVMRVMRNTLARRALVDTDFECMGEQLKGPLLLAFSMEDPGSAARIIHNFTKDHDALVVKVVSIGGQLLEPQAVEALAKLPTRDEAISLLMAVMKAPVGKLTRTMVETYGKLVRTVAAVGDNKEAS